MGGGFRSALPDVVPTRSQVRGAGPDGLVRLTTCCCARPQLMHAQAEEEGVLLLSADAAAAGRATGQPCAASTPALAAAALLPQDRRILPELQQALAVVWRAVELPLLLRHFKLCQLFCGNWKSKEEGERAGTLCARATKNAPTCPTSALQPFAHSEATIAATACDRKATVHASLQLHLGTVHAQRAARWSMSAGAVPHCEHQTRAPSTVCPSSPSSCPPPRRPWRRHTRPAQAGQERRQWRTQMQPTRRPCSFWLLLSAAVRALQAFECKPRLRAAGIRGLHVQAAGLPNRAALPACTGSLHLGNRCHRNHGQATRARQPGPALQLTCAFSRSALCLASSRLVSSNCCSACKGGAEGSGSNSKATAAGQRLASNSSASSPGAGCMRQEEHR